MKARRPNADLECPIAVFDIKGSSQVSADSAGWKGVQQIYCRALGIIWKELKLVEGQGEEKVMSFNRMTHGYESYYPHTLPLARMLMTFVCRRPAAPPRSFSRLSSSGRVTATSYLNQRRSRTSNYLQEINYESISSMDLLHHLYKIYGL